ncbi:MAG TPA: DUF2071 domain-containing protein, partial [Roseimicrobium sp.]|nr:DUF2071 domain-containing protein [Roseimicrobium sp.]
AIVSLVAFTMRRMRLRLCGRWLDWITAPVSTHEFLNVRTYVRHGDDTGIQFLAEWLPNPLSRILGPLTYGLPYRLGRIEYQHNRQGAGLISGTVESGNKKVAYHGGLPEHCRLNPASAGTLDDFLLERYTAFTFRKGVKRYFRVWHPPWQQTSIRVQIDRIDLLTQVWPWFAKARYIGAHYSPGVKDVWMGRPHRIVENEFS